MKEGAENKARRRRSVRESFATPLNQIALSHVDTVHSLDKTWRDILDTALAKVAMAHITTCLLIIKGSGGSIKNAGDLIVARHLSESPIDTIQMTNML